MTGALTRVKNLVCELHVLFLREGSSNAFSDAAIDGRRNANLDELWRRRVGHRLGR